MAAIHRSLNVCSGLVLTCVGLPLATIARPAVGSHGAHGHQGPGMIDPSLGFHHDISRGFHHPGGGAFVYSPSLMVIGPGGLAPFLGPVFPGPVGMGGGGAGLQLPMPPRALGGPAQPVAARRSNPARAKELVEIGDRSFRGHNTKRAEEKYHLAIKADPTSPVPHVHLAQVSIARGNYAAAADHLRDAVTVSPDVGWLANAPDIQAIFGEPGDFAKQLARLETHLQANPNDRDGWFVLGAETYLSGRARQAFDVFQRLTDRRLDEALTAFLDASKPRPAAEN